MRRTFTAESVTEGHPDKVADYIADSILDAYLGEDPESRVAVESLVKSDHVIVAGEITSRAEVDHEAVVRQAVREVGYTDPGEPFSADGLRLTSWLTPQAPEIGQAVLGLVASEEERSGEKGKAGGELGAGDQGIMVGYATDETPELMPLPILLAHRLARGLAEDRRSGAVPWLRPDGKTQVSVQYEADEPARVTHIVISTQHASGTSDSEIVSYVCDALVPRALGDWARNYINILSNPSGSFVHGGPSTDCGLTGRKNIVDGYGPLVRHGGGSFSGKDPTKVDRSGAYFCRYVARQIVRSGVARRAEVQVAYAIGRSEPLAVSIETFGGGDARAALEIARSFDFRPAAIIERLGLRRPIYRTTTNYGHFGRPGLPWEADA